MGGLGSRSHSATYSIFPNGQISKTHLYDLVGGDPSDPWDVHSQIRFEKLMRRHKVSARGVDSEASFLQILLRKSGLFIKIRWAPYSAAYSIFPNGKIQANNV